jgi:hypothetical protein
LLHVIALMPKVVAGALLLAFVRPASPAKTPAGSAF